jgi:hypothetical protein
MKKTDHKMILIPVILVAVSGLAIGILLWIFNKPGKYEMPAVPFAYRTENNDIYIFAFDGSVYLIDRTSGKNGGFDWEWDTIDAVQNDKELDWLKLVGNTDTGKLQKQYNEFREITDDPEYGIYETIHDVPAVEPNDQYTFPKEYWYGYDSNSQVRNLFYQGYLQYKATDENIYDVVDWITAEALRCGNG